MLDELYLKLTEYYLSENLEEKHKLEQEIVEITNNPEILEDYNMIFQEILIKLKKQSKG